MSLFLRRVPSLPAEVHTIVSSEIVTILVFREFSNVFPDDLPGLSPDQDAEFSIELVSVSTPIFRRPYCMAPKKLREIKTQLHELMDKAFIRPSSSPWDYPTIFVKKENTLMMCVDYHPLNAVMIKENILCLVSTLCLINWQVQRYF